jgi:pimeloyl-ACP methyl ester carboxylesterase
MPAASGSGVRALRVLALHPDRVISTRVPMLDEPLPPVPVDCAPWPGRVLRSGGVTLHVRETPGPTCEQVSGLMPRPCKQVSGELVVYVHGLGGSATNFTDLAGLVATRVAGLAVDLPGFGRSEPERGFDYRLQSHATALGDFLAGLDRGPLHLVGNSMGGAVVLLVAARHPELVRTLTLISPAMPDLRIDPRRTSDPRFALAFLPLVGGRVLRAIARTSPARRTEQVLRLCFAEPSAVSAVRRAQAEEEFVERQGMEWALARVSTDPRWSSGAPGTGWSVSARHPAPPPRCRAGNSWCCPAPATSPRWNDRRRWPARCWGCSTPTRAGPGELQPAKARVAGWTP